MTASSSTLSERLSPTLTQEVEQVCDAFEAAWKSGPPPRVEDFLAQGPEAARSTLLWHLLGVDTDYRRKRGEQPRPEDYAGRFPAFSLGWIAEALDLHGPPGAPDVPAAFAPGQVLVGRYEIRAELGRGGMGVIFQAADHKLHRDVAVKVLRTDQAGAGARERFLREARALAALDDEHVVPIYEVGEADGHPFFTMPLLRGESLARRLERYGAFPAAAAARLGEQVARGLAAAHAQGIVHRDVKPSNIWLKHAAGEGEGDPDGWGQATLMDFGLTRTAAPSDEAAGPDSLTLPGTLLGTIRYMAPEQVDDPARADSRSDLFSLGCVLYEAATGRRAFDGPTTTRVLSQLATVDPPPPAAVNPAIPPALSALIAQLLAKVPALRPAPAGAVADRFRELQTAPPAAAPRRRRAALGAALLAVLLLVAGAGYVRFGRPPAAPESGPLEEVTRSKSEGEASLDREVAQWALNNGSRLVVIHTAGSDDISLTRGATLPEGPIRLIRLDLRHVPGIGDDVLTRIGPLSSLRYLDLNSSLLTDDSLKHIVQPRLFHLRLTGITGITDQGAKRLGQMTKLIELYIGDTSVTDVGLEHLQGLTHLKELDLRSLGRVTDDGLRHLQHFPELRMLYLQRTKVTDAGLEYLKPLKHLEVLYLDDLPGITDKGLQHLEHFEKLQKLNVTYTKVTAAGAQAFEQARPGCKVIR